MATQRQSPRRELRASGRAPRVAPAGALARLALAATALVAALAETAPAQTTVLAPGEVVEFFPTDAHFDAERDLWLAPVHALVFEPERDASARRAELQALASALELPLGVVGDPIFVERARPFLVSAERSAQLVVRLAGQTVRLDASGAGGHAHGLAEIPGLVVRSLPDSHPGWLTVSLVLPHNDARRIEGRVRLLPPAGLSVLADLDDTLRISEVTDRARQLSRTCLLPFEAVPGMADFLRRCSEAGADFHYFSSSPWQLHAPLTAFLDEAGFPAGPLFLREMRWKDLGSFDWRAGSQDHKLPGISRFVQAAPGRKLILLGNSGERDPEVFGEVARRWPDNVARILVRDVTGEARGSERYASAFRGVPDERWSLFKDAAELASLCPPAELEALRPAKDPGTGPAAPAHR